MAGKAKTAQKGKGGNSGKRVCPVCGSDSRVVQFAGFGKKGFYWVCENGSCDYSVRTR